MGDGNHLDADAIYAILTALSDNPKSAVSGVSCSHQLGLGLTFGKRVEQAAANLVSKNARITRLNILMQDAQLSGVLDRSVRQNRDHVRRTRKRSILVVQGKIEVAKPLDQ